MATNTASPVTKNAPRTARDLHVRHLSGEVRWLRRYLDEKEPKLKNFAKVVRSLAARAPALEAASVRAYHRAGRP